MVFNEYHDLGDFTFLGINYDPLKNFGFTEDMKTSLIALFSMYVGFTFLAYLVLKLVAAKNT